MPAQAIVTSPDEACQVAARIGYPVVLKDQLPNIAHKSDVGGVMLNIGNDDGMHDAYAAISAAVARNAPQAYVEGMLVQKMSGKGRELAVGVIRGRDFGPMLMLAAGGVIEVMDDAVYAPLPL